VILGDKGGYSIIKFMWKKGFVEEGSNWSQWYPMNSTEFYILAISYNPLKAFGNKVSPSYKSFPRMRSITGNNLKESAIVEVFIFKKILPIGYLGSATTAKLD